MQISPSSETQTPCISAMPLRLTRSSGAASRCFIVGSSVCPPPNACAPSVFSAAAASAIVPGFANSKSYISLAPVAAGHAPTPSSFQKYAIPRPTTGGDASFGGDGRHVLPARGHDRLDDIVVPGAAADIALEIRADLCLGRRGVLLKKRRGGHDHAR